MDKSVQERIFEIVSEQLGSDIKDLTPESRLTADLGADSLDMVEMVMALEDEFNTEVSDEKVENFTKLSEIINYMTELTSK